MSLTNETRSIKSHDTCKCICRLNKIVCYNKQRLNKYQCRCECKKLINKGLCEKGYIFNPSNCQCECDKSCNTSQYLDYLDCKCKKKIVDLIVEQCIEYDDNNKTKIVNKTYNETKIINETVKNSCNVYIILTLISIVISAVYTIHFVHYNWFLIKNKNISLNIILIKKH